MVVPVEQGLQLGQQLRVIAGFASEERAAFTFRELGDFGEELLGALPAVGGHAFSLYFGGRIFAQARTGVQGGCLCAHQPEIFATIRRSKGGLAWTRINARGPRDRYLHQLHIRPRRSTHPCRWTRSSCDGSSSRRVRG